MPISVFHYRDVCSDILSLPHYWHHVELPDSVVLALEVQYIIGPVDCNSLGQLITFEALPFWKSEINLGSCFGCVGLVSSVVRILWDLHGICLASETSQESIDFYSHSTYEVCATKTCLLISLS